MYVCMYVWMYVYVGCAKVSFPNAHIHNINWGNFLDVGHVFCKDQAVAC